MSQEQDLKSNQKLVMKGMKIKRSRGEIFFDNFNITFMIIWSIITLYPFWYVLVMSFNTGADAARGPIWFWPREFTLENYRYVFGFDRLQSAFLVTIARCILAPTLSVFVTMMAAFALSKPFLPGRKIITGYLIAPMFIGGSMISTYFVYAKLGLVNNFLVYIVPGMFAYFTMIIMRTHVENIPMELQESAMMDGCSYTRIFFQILLPLCKPVMAAFMFFGVVGAWLDYYTTLIYVPKRSLSTLQFLLFEIIHRSEANMIMEQARTGKNAQRHVASMLNSSVPTPEVMKMAVMVVVTFPILFIYPFFQKYFVKGALVGAVKG